ncbi:hypothetical protein E2C01_087113 [Portunus trituberculatus]|uniref:Uncharacterized protein n=1 Tax=Portunus trituberculatus TaxID=210409 RepID=A0A5B7J7A0_PORTR|nr:hypothetical protein [Portunus trituberculatus]
MKPSNRRSRDATPLSGDTGLAGHWGKDQLRDHQEGWRPSVTSDSDRHSMNKTGWAAVLAGRPCLGSLHRTLHYLTTATL